MRKTFDDIIRRRWEEKQFPVSDDHRQRMIELLGGKKRRRAFAIWWWGAGAVVLVAGYFLLQAMPKSVDTSDSPNAAMVDAGLPAGQQQQVQNDLPSIAESTTATTTSTSAASSASAASNGVVENASSSPDAKSTLIHKSDSPTNGSKVESTMPANTVKATQDTPASENAVKQTKPSSNQHPPATKQDANFTLSTKPSGAIDNPGAEAVDVREVTNHVESISTGEAVIAKPAITATENATIQSEVEPSTPAATPVAETRNIYDIEWLDALPLALLPNDANWNVRPVTPSKSTKHPLYGFMEAGAGMILPAKHAYKTGVKLHAGAGVGYLMHPRLHAMLSGGYLVQDGGFDFERTSTITSFGFAARSQNNSLKPDRLHYVYSKLGLVYRIQRHSIGVSGGLQWLYGAQGEITTYTTGTFESANAVTRRAWLSLNGLNRMQWNASIQYGYRLTPRIHLAAGTQYYFNPLIAEDPSLDTQGYDWGGKTAKWQPFFTINYLLYGPF